MNKTEWILFLPRSQIQKPLKVSFFHFPGLGPSLGIQETDHFLVTEKENQKFLRARSNPTKWVIADKDKINIDQSLLPFSPTGGLEVDGSATSTGADNQTSNAAKKTEPTPTVVKQNITAKQKEVPL